LTARAEKANRIGELVGAKYRIVRMLAEGGMGVVYEAQHEVVKRRFAIKFLRPDLAERRDILNRFQREAEAAGALESENVAAAVDFGIATDGTPYIVMEYLVGESLGSLLQREGHLPVARAADLASQAGRGIQVAHGSGIIHRDLKPQNLFLCRRHDGTDLLKVLDFGVAKLQAIDEMNAATRTGAVLGTVAYMSPEQARGDKVVDQRSDVYALGAILYEMVSGQKPHPGESHNAILHHIATHPAVPLESVEAGLPAGFGEIVARALSSDPEARPASAEAFVEALVPFAGRAVWSAPKLEDSGPTRATAERRPSVPPATPTSPAPPRRLRPFLVAGFGAIAIAVVVVAVVRQRSTPSSLGSAGVDSRQLPATVAVTAAPAAPAAATPAAPAAAAARVGVRPAPPSADGRVPARAVRRHGGSTPTSTSASTPSSPAPVGKSHDAPITFDQDNPYK